MVQSLRLFLFLSKTPWVDVHNLFWIIFGCLKVVPGPSKTWIPYSTSIKNQVLQVSTCNGSVLQHLGVGAFLGGQQGFVFVAATGISCFWRPSGDTFGWYAKSLLLVPRCFFTLFGVAFLGIFEKASVVVALCTSNAHCRHFASSLPVLMTS